MLETLDIGALTRRITELPPLPQAVMEVMQALRRETLSSQRSIELIEMDQALAARTLRLANSAFYGAPGRVGSIGDAVRMLGLRTVSGVLTAAALHSSLKVDACEGFSFDDFWRHGIGTALTARALAARIGMDPDEAFLAGLMSDIGQLALATFVPLDFARAIEAAHAQDIPQVEAETLILGVAHPHIGALVIDHWRFPADITSAVARHHDPTAPPSGQRLSLSGLIHIADAMTHALDLSTSASEAVPAIDTSAWQQLGLADEDLLAILASTEHGVKEMCEALQC
jgi:HD-like signal output (HDOD) protein